MLYMPHFVRCYCCHDAPTPLLYSACRWNDLNVSTTSQTLGYDRYLVNSTNTVTPLTLDSDSGVSVSSYLPLWGGLFPAEDDDWTSAKGLAEREAILTSLSSSGLIQEGKNLLMKSYCFLEKKCLDMFDILSGGAAVDGDT